MRQKVTDQERAILITLALIIISYALQSPMFLAFSIGVGSVFLLGWVWQRYALSGLEYHRDFSERRAFVGETVKFTLSITNRKPLPLTRVRLTDHVSAQLVFTDLTLATSHLPGMAQIRQYFALSWFEQIKRTYHLRCDKRGIYSFRNAHLETGDPFHLFTVEAECGQLDQLIVYPSVKPVAGFFLPAKEPFGERLADRRLLQDPIYMRGTRPYQPEDDLRFVHWKATARTQELQTKIFEPTNVSNVILFVNIATFANSWEGIDPEQLERLVSVSASLCADLVQQRLVVGLSANGALPLSDQPLRVPAGRSPQQLTRLLEALAAVRGIASAKFEDFLWYESTRLPWGATLLIVTSVITPELEAVLIRLKDAGRKIALLSLTTQRPRWLRGMLTYHLLGRDGDDVFQAIPITVPESLEEPC